LFWTSGDVPTIKNFAVRRFGGVMATFSFFANPIVRSPSGPLARLCDGVIALMRYRR
jgi:hypothetical protein